MRPEALSCLRQTLQAGEAWTGLVTNRGKNGDFCRAAARPGAWPAEDDVTMEALYLLVPLSAPLVAFTVWISPARQAAGGSMLLGAGDDHMLGPRPVR
jgi:hypothetical protein